MTEQKDHDLDNSWAYFISGTLLIIGGQIGYNSTSKPVEKFAYSLSQSLGVGAFGYGFSLRLGRDADREFYESVQKASLSETEKDRLIRSYVEVKSDTREKEKWIRLITYGAVGALNIVRAVNESDETVRAGLYFLGGVNVLLGFSCVF